MAGLNSWTKCSTRAKNVAHEFFISEPTVNFCKASPFAPNTIAARHQRCYAHCSMAEAAQTRTAETQLFHDVFNASPIGIAVENLGGQPLFVNPAFCSFLGFSQEELRNKPVWIFLLVKMRRRTGRFFSNCERG